VNDVTAIKRIGPLSPDLADGGSSRLAERLISSLDETDEAENERLWVAESARRYHAYKAGKIPSRPADGRFAGRAGTTEVRLVRLLQPAEREMIAVAMEITEQITHP
jgi:hypothetical protein